jgi:CO/xanthine dehydrogenase Mo-binding subunit
MAGPSVVGKSIFRLDALEKVTGRAKYCEDIMLPGMLYGKVLRSPYAYAHIRRIDTSRAKAMSGVRAVITGEDVPEKRYGPSVFDQHVLARRVVRYVGDSVAAVAADRIDVAERALDLITIEYEELPAIFDIEEAWQKNPSVIVHRDLPGYELGKFPPPRLIPDRPNVCNLRKLRHGDVERGLREADLIVENRFTTTRIQHCPFELHVSIAQAEPDGGLTVWAGRQSIFLARQYLCKIFELPPSRVRVIASHYIGGGFGGKVTLYTEPIASLLSMKTGKPVKLSFTREEMFSSGGTRVPFVIRMRDGVKKDGMLVAREMEILLGMGAYAGSGPLITRNCIYGAVATYRIPNAKIDAYAVYTNEPPVTSYRGFGTSQVVWAVESQMDIIAQQLGMDAVELRRRNLLEEGDTNITGEIVHSIGIRECLDKVADSLKWGTKSKEEVGPWKRGKGLALGNKYSMAPTAALAIVKVRGDGTIEVHESADEMGQGCNTVLAQIAAEEFGVSIGDVKVVWGDTALTPYFSRGSTSQRTTFNVGNAIRLACQDAKRQIYEIAAERLHVASRDMGIKDGTLYVKSNPSQCLSITELFSSERELLPGEFGDYVEGCAEIIGRGIWITRAARSDPETAQIPEDEARMGGRMVGFYGYGVQGVEVLVNVETGEVRVEKVAAASDAGYPLNPKMCEQQMEGGVAMGLGSALWEEVVLDSVGKVLNPNFGTYKIATSMNMPKTENVKVYLVSAPHKDGPFGAKGTGETQMTPTAPAVANAIYDAVGVRIKDLPITGERVFRALREKVKG